MDEPSRSVALPFPSSPHWAPRTTIAGIGHLSHWRGTGARAGAGCSAELCAELGGPTGGPLDDTWREPGCATASGLLRHNVSRAPSPPPRPDRGRTDTVGSAR